MDMEETFILSSGGAVGPISWQRIISRISSSSVFNGSGSSSMLG
jgi:hypothetical protein